MPETSLPVLERVTLRRRIGRGGMADVYLGIHDTLNRLVAVKILHAHLAEDESLRRRFHAEARAVAGLRHSNIVQVYDFGILDGRPYIIMEYVDGPPLAAYLRDLRVGGRGIPLPRAARVIAEIAAALDYAHARGIVHRDVKPANILLRPFEQDAQSTDVGGPGFEAVLSDFGVARVAQSTAATLSGMILGTPAYMGPEQVTGGQVDARTDIYSLGVVLYEVVTGKLPYSAPAETPAAVMFKHVHETPAPLPEQLIALQPVVDRALAKEPGARYGTAGSLAQDVRTVAGGGTPKAALVASPMRAAATSNARGRRLSILALAAISLLGVLSAFGLPRVVPSLLGQEGEASAAISATLPATATPLSGSPERTLMATTEATGVEFRPPTTGSVAPSSTTESGSKATTSAPTATPTTTPSETATFTSVPTAVPSRTPRPTLTPTNTPIITLPDLDLLN